MSILKIFLLIFILCGCGIGLNNSFHDDDFLSSEDYNYQSFPYNRYRFIIQNIIIDNPLCGTRSQAADLIGETEEFGVIRLLLPCVNIQNLNKGDTIYFVPVRRPEPKIVSTFYLKKELSTKELNEIIKTPTTFANISN